MGQAAWKIDEYIGTDIATDTRTTDRANVYLSVDVFSGQNFWTGLTMNMSAGGVFIATANALPLVGSTVVLNIALPFESEAVVVLAEVRWTRPYTAGSPAGIGLAFVDLSCEALAKIARFVTEVHDPLDFDS